jgi:hypothetical protein
MASAKVQPKRSVLIAARLITAVVSLAGAEGVLWFGGYPNWWAMDPAWGGGSPEYEADEDLGWKARKGEFTMVWADGSDLTHPFHYTNWTDGRRATAEQESAIPNQPRVLFFGDSFIQGYGLSDAETLPWIVQRRHPELQVSNYGAGLYGTYQSYLSMKKWVREPASVYYLFNAFHEDRNAASPFFLRILKPPPPGFFYPYAELADGKIDAKRSGGELVWTLARHLRTVAMVQDYSLMFKSYSRLQNKRRVTELLLASMNDVVAAAGGKFTVILFDLNPEERTDYRRFLESQHIAYIDCDRPERNDPSLRLSDLQHPTPKLNQLLAEWIEPVLAAPAQVVSVRTDAALGAGGNR